MSKFSEEVRIISPIAWLLAALGAVILFCCLNFWAVPRHFEARHWSHIQIGFFSLWPSAILFCWVLVIGYINADAGRRGMSRLLWTLIAMFVPNLIGIILYFLLRESLLVTCPKCGTPGRKSFVFCPQCGGELCPVCPVCRHATEPGWKKCAYCGAAISPAPGGSPQLRTT